MMRDPVTLSTGQTYDRASIESWVATGNLTCPVTRTPLTDFTFIPNHTLRRLIHDWCAAHGGTAAPKQQRQPPADAALVRSLLAQAESADSVESSRVAALRRLRTLARDSDKNRRVISSEESESIAARWLWSLSPWRRCCRCRTRRARPSPHGRSVCRGWRPCSAPPVGRDTDDAAAVIEAVSAAARSQDLRVTVGSTAGVVEGLVRLVELHCRHQRAGNVAIRALFSLCLAKENRELAVSAGAAGSLMSCVAAGDLQHAYLERALATVELLCRAEGGVEVVVGHGGAVAALVKVMAGKVSDRAAEHAVGALVAVCAASEELQREAVENGVLGWLLLMVQSNCTERAKRKAQMLLKLLRAAWPRYDSLTNSDDFQFQTPPRAVSLR
ncbi:unnamed protein product [Spirodela intermedia]|uniref:U-box domain-containing protein n=1 Tax=Spirodela intermedia TaxID=51605 RepID=A0A7I8J0N4_SPIIN|nr:unnamed protein product [Spirodela intermedia]CAA6663794.1 unnamed protein product [Spirodela intermedia]